MVPPSPSVRVKSNLLHHPQPSSQWTLGPSPPQTMSQSLPQYERQSQHLNHTMSDQVCEPATFSIIEGIQVEHEVMEWSLFPSAKVDVNALNFELLIDLENDCTESLSSVIEFRVIDGSVLALLCLFRVGQESRS